MTLALERLRVLDLTQVMAGPFCCQLLADMGAQVTKVEPIDKGDASRHSMGFRGKGDENVSFLAVNRNKHSVALDLKKPRGREVFHRLVGDADVVAENFRPGVTARLGVDYETLREVNPRIIYASISGFGQTGPYASRAGYDLIAQAMSGVMSVTGEPDGPPVKCGIPIGDLGAGLYAAFGILAAYLAREQTGVGQHVDVSLFEAALALSVWETTELWTTGRIPKPFGSAHRLSAPYQALRTRDGHVTVGANNERLWPRFCRAIGREDLLTDPRFASNLERVENRPALQEELESVMRHKTTDEWVTVLLDAGVPCGPIRNYAEVCEDPHTLAREMVVEMDHPVEGRIHGLGIPVKLSETPGSVRRAAPLLGEHTDEVLARHGFAAEEIAQLREEGVVG
ncbi:MAG: CoA transferase [Streptosporangiales bacterium]|nr:CoA transferase [Streptosporangiales bacterium]